ncbi:unnamed protein product [Paramecium sonneborni]|uniref:Queuine tRNA-ribosyltransferase catalytic subunit 1 n=1 Tax=Paramecium sonneborni TaxID=65129 RepID=A0A8S1PVT7_9CILI|nr:unnamed protein product [Paramecium sonneborni]
MQELEEYEIIKQKKIKLNEKPRPLEFTVLATHNFARASILKLPHGEVKTPVYMPVGTKGAMKGVTYQEMDDMGCKLLLANTYHLAYKPSGDLLEKVGGLHKFVNWKHNILTDSGGFQMVSLSQLSEVNEDGVTFESPYDKTIMHLRPEDSIHTQNQIGADIIMALDDVVRTTTVGPRMQEASERTTRWLDRDIAAHKRKEDQNLFPIVQGGIDPKLREQSLDDLIQREANGYAIGGLAGGEDKVDFWKTVAQCTAKLPNDKPRYLMGVGYPVDVVVCSCLGVDMFDCVFSTRTARFGTAFTDYGFLKLKNSEIANVFQPIQQGCQCQACKSYTQSYLHYLIAKEQVACHLISIHNLNYLIQLMLNLRQSIIDGKLIEFVNQFLKKWYQKEGQIPQWIIEALDYAKIPIQQI